MATPQSTSNSTGREFAFKFLYQWMIQTKEHHNFDDKEVADRFEEYELHSHENPDHEEMQEPMDKNGRKMALDLCLSYRKHYVELNSLVDTYNKSKTLDPMTRLLSVLGAAEIFHMSTPVKVVINEYVQITKKYGAPGAHGVVNAILDKLAKEKGK